MRNLSRRLATRCAVFAALGVMSIGVADAAQFDTIGLTGSLGTSLGAGPNIGPGVDFASLAVPAIDSAGNAGFAGVVAGTSVDYWNNDAVFASAGGSAAVAAREGIAGATGPNLAPGTVFYPTSTVTSAFRFNVFNPAGLTIVYGDVVDGPYDTIRGLFSNAAGTLDPIAYRHPVKGPGPNLGENVLFSTFYVPAVNGSGNAAFKATLSGSATSSSNNLAIFTNIGGVVTPIARTTASRLAQLRFSNFGVPVMNASNRFAFQATADSSPGQGIYSDVGGSLALIASSSSSSGPGPNLGAGVSFSTLGDPTINSAGTIAFLGSLGLSSGIFTHATGINTVVARTGATGPGPNLDAGVIFNALSDPVLNAGGTVAFTATLVGAGVTTTNDTGIFTGTAGSPVVAVAREGVAGALGPKLGTGVAFSTFNGPTINADGDVAFLATLTGGSVNSSNNTALCTNAAGSLEAVVRTGDLFDVDPGAGASYRLITGITFLAGAGGEDGRSIAFNDAGMLAFGLSFSDGSSGVFTALAPDPASGMILSGMGLGAVAVGRPRKRGR